MKNTVPMAVVLVTASCLSTTTNADLVASFDFDGLAANQTMGGPSVVNADVSSSGLALAPGFALGGWSDAITGLQNNGLINSLASAIAGDEYFTLTITPDAEKSVSYSSMFVHYSLGANTQPAETTFAILSSVTGFTASDAIDSFVGSAAVAFNTGTDSFDLSGATALQDAADMVEFRIYAFNSGVNPMTRIGIGRAFSNAPTDALVLNGTITAVPEPSSLLFLGAVTLLGAVSMQWNRKTSSDGSQP